MKIGDATHFRFQPGQHCWPARVVISGAQPTLDVANDTGNTPQVATGGEQAVATAQNTWHLPADCPDGL